MGASSVKEAGGSEIECLPNQDTTPKRELGMFKRQLPFDPRSPTDNIMRTPIIVTDAPDSLAELDPRSPTIGIERTPLAVLLTEGMSEEDDVEMEVDTDPLGLPISDLAPLCLGEDTSDTAMTTPPKPNPEILSQDPVPSVDINDASSLLSNAEQIHRNLADPTPMQVKQPPYPKKLFTSNQSPVPPSKPSSVCRSPLGLVAVDSNSPRNIVQSKQRRQVAKSLGGFPGRMAVDKENLAH